MNVMKKWRLPKPNIGAVACLVSVMALGSCSGHLSTSRETNLLEICVWRHGNDGLTARLADKVEEYYGNTPGYVLGCDGEPRTSLHILQITDWEKVDERIRMVVNIELESAAEWGGATTAVYCWEDDIDRCAKGVIEWVNEGLSNAG